MNYEMEPVPPCKVYRPGDDGTLLLVEVITERPRQDLQFRRSDVPDLDGIREPWPLKPAVEPAAQKVNPPKKPREPRAAGPGRGNWNRIAGLTQEWLLAGYRRGATTPELARELKCRPQTILFRIMRWRRESKEFRALDDALMQCPSCKQGKQRQSPVCGLCAQRRRKQG
jgi:hypothetical protein